MTRWVVAVMAGEVRESVLESWTTSTDQVLVVRTTDAVEAATHLAALPGTHVFLVARPARHALLHQTSSLLSALRPEVAVVRFPTTAATVTAAAVATTIAPLGLDPNAAATLLEQALAGAHSGAWVPKVTGLEFPQPSVGQHLGGMFSREGFVAALTPTPAVTRPAGIAPAPLGDHVLLSGPDLPPAVLHTLQQAYRVGQHVTVPAIGVGREEYGANGVEFVLLPPAARLHPGPALGACRECGLPLYGTPRCPTCRVMHQPNARPAVA
ncbi:hypothetical protein, partial [Kribbia dieselivorans]|uniref:hypothetical protein n=1 Tax=Kribbia dieselivorans TaxID=331526 RepID=UPI0012EE33C3